MNPNKTALKPLLAFCAALLLAACSSQPEMVTISGRVTDFDGNPVDSASVTWMNPAFDGDYYAITDADGYYTARIPKGRYAYAGGMNMAEYALLSSYCEADQRLENWHWNYLAEQDTTFNFRYHRLEVYGVNAFQVQGAAPGYTVYFRPMSLSRFQAWVRCGKPVGDNGLAPDIDSAKIEVTIDGEPVKIRMAQHVMEYFDAENWSGAYLLFVDRPKNNRPTKTFRIVMEDMGNGDKGEATYTLEEQTEYVWPKGEIDANYKKD